MGRSRYLPFFEAIVGLVAPLLLAGPWVLMGLVKGIGSYLEASKMPYPEMAHQNALVFLLPATGGVGLISILLLMVCGSALRRNRFTALLTTAGLVAGTYAAGWFLIGTGLMEFRYPSRGGFDWRPSLIFALVLIPPMVVGWRRVVLLWLSPSPTQSEARPAGP